MYDESQTLKERADAAQRRGEERDARLRRALDEDAARAADAERERREATRPLRRGAP